MNRIRKYLAEHKIFTRIVVGAVLLEVAMGVAYWPGWSPKVGASVVTIDGTLSTTDSKYRSVQPREVFVTDQVGYIFYAEADGSCAYNKTTDGGATWGTPVAVYSSGQCIDVSIWYDQWTPGDNTGTYVYIFVMEGNTNDIWYYRLDTSNDNLTSAAVLTNGVSGAPNKTNSFANNLDRPGPTKGTDGTLYVAVSDDTAGDASYILKCSSSCSTGSSWSDAGTSPLSVTSGGDHAMLRPLSGGSILLIRLDTANDDLLSKVWNGTAWDASWATIDSNAVASSVYETKMFVTQNRSTYDIYLAYATDNTTLNGDEDIRTATYSSGTWTAKTDVLTNSATRGVIGVAIAYDEAHGAIYVAYRAQTTPGSAFTARTYWKQSADGMTTWKGEHGPVDTAADDSLGIYMNVMSSERIFVSWQEATGDALKGDTLSDLKNNVVPVDKAVYFSGTTASFRTHDGAAPTSVYVSDQVGYAFFRNASGKCAYRKTSDGGSSWSGAVEVDASTTCAHVSIWYDQWTPGDTTGTNIHILLVDTTADDLKYNSLDTSSDTLLMGNSALNITTTGAVVKTNTFDQFDDNYAYISKSTAGVVYAGVTDSGGGSDEGYVLKCASSCGTGSSWSDTSANVGGSDNTGSMDKNDTIVLMPLANGDMLMILRDTTAADVLSKVYTAGTTTWDAAWTTVDANATYDATFAGGDISATVNRWNNKVMLVYADNGGASDNIKTASYASGTWTAKGNVQTGMSMALISPTIAFNQNNGDVYVAYGAYTSSEANGEIYYKTSSDDMSTWSSLSGPLGQHRDYLEGVRLNIASDQRLHVTWVGDGILYSRVLADLVPPTVTQTDYRLFANADSTTPGAPLAAADTASYVTPLGQPFRLRLLLHISGDGMAASYTNFKLQYALKAGTCDTSFSGENYMDIGTGGLNFYDNPSATDASNISSTGSDPSHSGHSITYETYQDVATFTTKFRVPGGNDALWDFSLIDQTRAAGEGLCFRVVKQVSSTQLDAYSVIPEFQRPALTEVMRHGNSFKGEMEQGSQW